MIIALSYVLDKSKSYIYLNPNFKLSEEDEKRIVKIENDLEDGEPLQYAIGEWEFYGLNLIVDQRALIPRFETEIIVDYIIKSEYNKDKILDIGAGSGAISLSLAYNLPKSTVIGVDIEDNALMIANENKNRLGLSNVNFIKSDLFTNVDDKFDLIVSNPPYISLKDYNSLDKVLYHEPKSALLGGDDGLYFYRKIIKDASAYLNDEGHLIFEIGYDQKGKISDLLTKSDFKNLEFMEDFNGFDRFIIAQKG